MREVAAVCWGSTIAAGAGLATWSGRLYLSMPWWPGTIAAAGVAGAALGWVLATSRFFRNSLLRASTSLVPVLVALGLVAAGQPADTGFAPNTWAGVRDYRGGCLTGTEYTDSDAALSITTDVVTLTGSRGGQLRFTRTGQSWQSPARAEIWGLSITPRDRATRVTLATVGCD
ncbi:hypothetical protein [Amycolatopsis sp. lyj-112]|uniref:hypothetical protein n=1 Tax=Amycolatopsis sp. lyj-112 TaxID=2789288 RepID=UPI00397AB873